MITTEIILQLKNVTCGYSDSCPVLRNVDFAVATGGISALVGPNGSGKSTLLAVSTGYLEPTSGEIILLGKPLKDMPIKERAKSIAWLTQELPSAPGYTVRQVVLLGRYSYLRGFGSYTPEDEEICREALGRCGIEHLGNRMVGEISGGERQRVFLAQALAQGARLMLLDEPTNHLDPASLRHLLELLRGLTEDGVAVLMVTHDLNLAARHAERIILLNEGRVVAEGEPEDVVKRELLSEVYGTEFTIIRHPLDAKPQILL